MAELDKAPSGAVWPDFLRDYETMRDEVRACQSVR